MSISEAVPVEVEAAPARWRHHAAPVALLILAPVLASALLLAGLFDNNPALFFSFLGVHVGGAALSGAPGWLDPTISLLTQPLGHLGAEDWLHGIVPWWNPYTGPGMPLAAEMQTLSFFLPFVLLLKFWQGWLYLKVVLQIMSGLAMYALLIELRCRRIAAFVPGLLFALNGTFFLVPHAMGPIPFLPLLLLGVERAARHARIGMTLGWGLVPLALAYSLYAGYPEVAYIDGLLVAVWVIWRLIGLGAARWRFAGKIALGTGIGLALSLPLIVPFLHYVQVSYLGAHRWLFSIMWLGRSAAPVQVLPFTYGPPGRPSALYIDWAELPGWFGLPALVLALAALRRGPHRGLAGLLLGFVLFWQARIWGFVPVVWLANLIPDLARTDAVRFAGVAMEAAIFIMAGLGLDAWLRQGPISRATGWRIALTGALILAVSLLAAAPVLSAWYHALPGLLPFGLIANGLEIAIAGAALVLLARQPDHWRAAILAGLVAADALAVAFMPQLAAPRTGQLDLAGVAYLQRHQGLAKFYTLQPFGPDYPAGFDLASINDNALPVARSWHQYLISRLDPDADVVMFTGAQPRLKPGLPGQTEELQRNFPAYLATGVKYVLALPGDDPFRRHAALPVAVADHALPLAAGQSFDGSIPAGVIGLRKISGLALPVGTYNGAARGRLDLRLCADGACAEGHADLDHAADNAGLPIRLDHDLPVPAGATLRYRFTHRSGSAVALWLGMADGRLTPKLRLFGGKLIPGVRRVFRDPVMSIYRLPHYRRYFSARPACRLQPAGRNHLIARCAQPASLTRLEAWFPGWHATVNGKLARLTRTSEIFQSVALPPGNSRIGFYYRPRGTRLSVAVALAALLLWLGLMARNIEGGNSGWRGFVLGRARRRQRHRQP